MSDLKNKHRINYVELTGNLARDAKVTEKATFITVATWNGKDKDGKDRAATFIDVSYFNIKDSSKLLKGQRVKIKGRLVSYKDKKTENYKLGVVGFSIHLVERTTNDSQEKTQETPVVNNKPHDDIPWEVDS